MKKTPKRKSPRRGRDFFNDGKLFVAQYQTKAGVIAAINKQIECIKRHLDSIDRGKKALVKMKEGDLYGLWMGNNRLILAKDVPKLKLAYERKSEAIVMKKVRAKVRAKARPKTTK